MKLKKALVGAARILLALVFIFSGFVKAVDPWGTAIKLGEYLQAFHLDFLLGGRYALSVLLSGGEMLLGLFLLFCLGGRATARLMLWVMLFFSLLTGVLALWNPVSDCGCFGDALKLTNWQTFYKNIGLLILSLIVVFGGRAVRDKWYHARVRDKSADHALQWALGFCFLLFSAGVGLYCLRHLPLIDFLPYKAGTDLAAQLQLSSGASAGEAILVYRDRESGVTREFTLQDTLWRDTLRWEFVDTRFPQRAAPSTETALDFALLDGRGDAAPELLASPQAWFLITLDELPDGGVACPERYADLLAYARAQGIALYGATPQRLPDDRIVKIADEPVLFYNIDATTFKTLIRAHSGVVLFQQGTLLAKWNCRDIPRFGERYADRSPLSYLAEAPVRSRLHWLLGVMGALLLLTYIVYFAHRGRR